MTVSVSWLGVAFAVGLLQSLAPEHGLPAQMKTWREGKSAWVGLFRVAGLFLLQALGGAVLYFLVAPLLIDLGARWFFIFALSFLFLFAWLRDRAALRVWGASAPVGQRAQVSWLQILAALGPAEYLVPLLLKSQQAGVSLDAVAFWFLMGMIFTAVVSSLWCHKLWESPYLLSRQVVEARSQGVWVPAVATGAMVLAFWAI